MNFTSKSKYALRAVIHLARANSGTMRRGDLAKAQGGISVEYLEKILLRLREKKIVSAKTGPGGGYRLAVPAADLTAWDVVCAVEESPHPVSCLNGAADACKVGCEAKPLWQRVWEAAVHEMAKTSIASLSDNIEFLDKMEQLSEEDIVPQCR